MPSTTLAIDKGSGQLHEFPGVEAGQESRIDGRCEGDGFSMLCGEENHALKPAFESLHKVLECVSGRH